MGIRVLICESDSQVAIELVNQPVNKFHRYACMIEGMKLLLNGNWEVEIKHTFREGNGCANGLAKLGAQGSEVFRAWR